MFDIVRTLKESDKKTDFVALGNLLTGETSSHSAFVINHEDKLYEFHYTGDKIEFIPIKRDYYHKITNTILPDEIPAFIALSKNIQKKSNPKYGFFYSGESYDVDGNHLSNKDLGEVMTCVGFCLNVLKGFLEEDYLQFKDWSSKSHENPLYLDAYCKVNKLDKAKIKPLHRRINPREYLISGFFDNLPIKKSEIDGKKEDIENHIKARLSI